MTVRRAAHSWIGRVATWRRYLRARLWSLTGATVARRVSVSRGCQIDRPWGVSLGERVTLEPHVWLKLVADEARLEVRQFTFLGMGCEIDVLQSVAIGEHTLIAPGCFITDHNHGIAPHLRIDQQPCLAAPVVIGSDVWVGARVCILAGVTIGDGAVVGAGAVVRSDVAPGAIVVGVPARQVGARSSTPVSQHD